MKYILLFALVVVMFAASIPAKGLAGMALGFGTLIPTAALAVVYRRDKRRGGR